MRSGAALYDKRGNDVRRREPEFAAADEADPAADLDRGDLVVGAVRERVQRGGPTDVGALGQDDLSARLDNDVVSDRRMINRRGEDP
jgi:hypothetical protein